MRRRTILASAATLAVMLFMLMPAQTSPQYGPEVKILKLTKILRANGRQKKVIFEAYSDAAILEIMIDNTPTGPGLESDYDFRFLKVGDSYIHPNWMPISMAQNDRLAVRPLFAWMGNLFTVPVAAGQKARFAFNTENGVNDVVIEITVCYIGGPASLY